MSCLTEAMGLSLPGCASTSLFSGKRMRIVREKDRKIVELANRDVKPRNMPRACNYGDRRLYQWILHLTVIVNEFSIDLPVSLFNDISSSQDNRLCPNFAEKYMYSMFP